MQEGVGEMEDELSRSIVRTRGQGTGVLSADTAGDEVET